jgi:hypothetical protein
MPHINAGVSMTLWVRDHYDTELDLRVIIPHWCELGIEALKNHQGIMRSAIVTSSSPVHSF